MFSPGECQSKSFESMNTLLSAIFKFCTTKNLFKLKCKNVLNNSIHSLNVHGEKSHSFCFIWILFFHYHFRLKCIIDSLEQGFLNKKVTRSQNKTLGLQFICNYIKLLPGKNSSLHIFIVDKKVNHLDGQTVNACASCVFNLML